MRRGAFGILAGWALALAVMLVCSAASAQTQVQPFYQIGTTQSSGMQQVRTTKGLPIGAIVVATCGTPPSTYTAGQAFTITMDTTGALCTSAGGGGGTTNVVTQASSAAGAATTSAQSTAAGSNLVVKASAGNLYALTVTLGATSGYLMLFDATSLPANGAVTPVYCIPVTSNGTNGYAAISFDPLPKRFGTGITAGFSTTGCFTLTASATASFFAGYQ